jgi:hypothetical protein
MASGIRSIAPPQDERKGTGAEYRTNGQRAHTAQTMQTSTSSASAQRDRAAATTSSLPQTGAQRSSTTQLERLDRDAKARQQGTERTQKYQQQSRNSGGRPERARRRTRGN